MKLPEISSSLPLKGKKIFLRVDWNVPLTGEFAAEDSLKIRRSVGTIRELSARGAIVLVATHLGRPKKKDASLSTKHLQKIAAHQKLSVDFLGDALDTEDGLASAMKKIEKAKSGDVLLLENVRFYSGEEKNDKKLAKAFASLADVFVNDAFASCHRAHASVVGVASLLPHYAGPQLIAEVDALSKLLAKPKKPYIAIIGGAKISTKIDVLNALLKTADKVLVGGAMANTCLAAKKVQIGKSIFEKEGMAVAKKLVKSPKLVLPTDAVVAPKIDAKARPHVVDIKKVKKNEMIGDIGPATMRAWSNLINNAKTIVWNGPVGVSEIPAFSHGSLVVGRAIAIRSQGKAYGVAGGGDTLPVALATGMAEWFDHLSTGGGAMLEFLANRGKLPGLTALAKK